MGFGHRSGFKSGGRSGGFRSGSRSDGFRPKKQFNSSPSDAPVREGEEADVTIEAVGEKGDGIARIKGFVIFVPNTKENDFVRIKVTKVLSNVGFGEVIGKAEGKPLKEGEMAKPKGKKTKKSADSDEGVSGLKSDEPSEAEEDRAELENEAEIEESEEF